jgi:hypothetical protein
LSILSGGQRAFFTNVKAHQILTQKKGVRGRNRHWPQGSNPIPGSGHKLGGVIEENQFLCKEQKKRGFAGDVSTMTVFLQTVEIWREQWKLFAFSEDFFACHVGDVFEADF